jgi:SAM-dependent methyltransferase
MDHEFQTAVSMCSLQADDVLLNIPSACIPLERYFQTVPNQYFRFETNESFAKLVGDPICSWTNIPLPDSSCSKIICIATLHHSTHEERKEIYRECWRLLRPGGSLIVGDCEKGSPQDAWLNQFVNQYNSNGHKGLFWSQEDCQLFVDQGYEVQTTKHEYPWTFSTHADMIDFCKHLFGLDKATDDDIRQGLQTYLHASDTVIPWGLMYFTATKPQIASPEEMKISASLPQE